MRIRLYDKSGNLKHDLAQVVGRVLTPAGDLVISFDPAHPLKRFVAYRGSWDHLHELDDDEPTSAPQPGAAGLGEVPTEVVTLTPPVVRGPYADRPDHTHTAPALALADPNLSLPNPYAGLLAEAMGIHCTCAMLRCPVVINPATAADRKWWQRRQQTNHDHWTISKTMPPSATAPFRRCIHENGHAAREDVSAHVWVEGGWPYGLHNHHPGCPRNPERYNRPTGEEGHPGTGGLTSADELAAEPTPDAPVHAASADIAAPWMYEHTGTLPRPYVAEPGAHRAN